MTNNNIIFNNALFSNALKEVIIEKIHNSNLISSKLNVDNFTRIDFNLNKDNNTYTLSCSTSYLGKDIHLEKTGKDVYELIPDLISTLERIMLKSKKH